MVIQFVSFDVSLPQNVANSSAALHQQILTTLRTWGDPLRWAITAIDGDRQIAQVEAMVTTPTELRLPGQSITTV